MKLKEIRIAHNITQKKLALDLNYNQTLVSMWEHNTREPSNKALIDIANYFNVSIDELLGRNVISNEIQLSTAQKCLIEKIKFLNDDQCQTLCSIIETFGNADDRQIMSDYKQLKKYED